MFFPKILLLSLFLTNCQYKEQYYLAPIGAVAGAAQGAALHLTKDYNNKDGLASIYTLAGATVGALGGNLIGYLLGKMFSD